MNTQNITTKIKENIARVIIGGEEQAQILLAAVLAGGHILLEDKPGTGKTMMAKALAKSIQGEFKRVQFTPDLMPADITGLNIYNRKEDKFTLVKGPVFTNVLLADEINRATPRTQSALLEAMEECQVTIDGETLPLQDTFVVLATENPVETTGTYPLPEAQLDRFAVKLSMGESTKEKEMAVMERFMEADPLAALTSVVKAEDIQGAKEETRKVFVHPCIREYIADIIMATRTSSKINVGASTRATLVLMRLSQAVAAMNGREFVIPDDVRYMAPYALAHRVMFVGRMDHGKEMAIISELAGTITVPVENWEK